MPVGALKPQWRLLLCFVLVAGLSQSVLPAQSQQTVSLNQPIPAQKKQPIRVAILDSGFRGYRQYLGTALPKTVIVKSFRRDNNLEARDSQHGILCAETIHALAPDAELLFANWEPNHPTSFLKAVQWAALKGAKVISCSIVMPTWSDGEGGGPIHRELDRLLGDSSKSDGVLFVACAGNLAKRHWHGNFVKGANGYHEWSRGVTRNQIIPWGLNKVSVELCGATGNDFEIFLYDHSTGQRIDHDVARENSDYRCGVVRFEAKPGHAYTVQVRAVDNSPGSFHLYVLGGSIAHASPWGSIPFPGDGPNVLAIGAVDERGARLSYSSCGPCSKQPKPNFVARVPVMSQWRLKPFTGTSAAAPQAAGVAARLWAQHPDWTAKQIRLGLRQQALDLGPKGHDWETGFGLLRRNVAKEIAPATESEVEILAPE